jgi:hypothetical protein
VKIQQQIDQDGPVIPQIGMFFGRTSSFLEVFQFLLRKNRKKNKKIAPMKFPL